MKVIDLLNKIANGEVDYEQQIKIDNEIINVSVLLGTYVFSKERFNDEVEIIEEDKKIKKIKDINTDFYIKEKGCETALTNEELVLDIQTLKHKINEIIDYLEEKE